jgi:TolB-like protein/Tfp pilus assembly protein PilF
VLLAEDTQLERFVAIKLMSAELAKDPNQRKRFRSEAKTASGLSHPNICVIYEVGETEAGQPFLAMEFVEGQTLEVATQRRRLSIREIIRLGIQIAGALEVAHARRIVHRDIKPGNIMLDRRGQVKVLDFGLAKRFEQNGLSDTTVLSSALTQTGMLIGTPYYMSPEQVLGHKLDHRSDIFSLGVVLYELITGQKPFLGKTVGETTNSIVNRRPDALGLENPMFSPALDRIVFKCLEKDPENRYGAAQHLAAELTQLEQQSDSAPAANVNNQTVVMGNASSFQPGEEPTKLWQLGRKADRPTYGSGSMLAGLIILFGAAAVGFYFSTSPGGRVAFSIAAIGIMGLAAYWWLNRSSSRKLTRSASESVRSGTNQQKSLAVLPFANFSAEKDSDYLSDGLTEEITSALSRVAGLKVAARNSAFAFKGRHENARRIGEVLGVSMLLEGSMRKSGQQIRVTAQLVNVADGYHVWTESFDRDVSNVIAVQDEIARRIAERLRVEIGSETSAAMSQRRAVNPEAHVLYLQARHAWNKRTRADIEQAIQLFRRAIDKDPAYADAHAGLAASYVILPGYAYRPASEYLPLARSAASRALELDPTSAEAHAVLGDAATQVGDFDNSLPHLRRAIELNPNYATGHQWYGAALLEVGRMEEALLEFRKAEELDPLSPIIRACIPEWYYLVGRNDEAIAESKKALEIFPDFSTLRKFLAEALLRKGLYRDALAEVNRARTSDAPARLDLLVFCEARLGNEAQARRVLSELEEWQTRGYDVQEELGYAHVGLRQYDQAAEFFERFAESGILTRSSLRDPLLLDEMRDHPRYRALLDKLRPKPSQLSDNTQAVSAAKAPPTHVEPWAARSDRRGSPALVSGMTLVAVMLVVGALLSFHSPNSTDASKEKAAGAALPIPQKSVAVLPFDNFSAEKDTDYLSDGLTDEITAALSRRPGLKVVARNSAFTFKGRKEDLRKVGAALGVATLLEGSLSKSGRQVRITAQLINAADGFHLWSETYDRSVEDLIAVQEDIARQIAERLHGESVPIKRQVIAP